MASTILDSPKLSKNPSAVPSLAPSTDQDAQAQSDTSVQFADAEKPSTAISDVSDAVPFNPGWRFILAFISLSTLCLMVALDATSLSVALTVMARALKGTAIEAFWAGTSFLLTSTVSQPIFGSFSEVFGRKSMLYIAITLFGIGAITAAVANDFTVILVGRSIQGIGGGGVICLTEIVATDLVPLRERGKWFSFFSAMWSVGTVVGPLLGGGFSQNITWRWIFWINLPFIGVAVPMVVVFLRLHHQTSSLAEKLLRIDWIGAIVFVASVTGLLIPITWGGVMYDWSSWRTLVPLVVCGVALIAFIIYEDRFAKNPLIRTRVFKNRTAASVFFQTVIHGLVLWCGLYYLPLYYEGVKGFTPILSGVALFPQTFTVAPSAMAAGFGIAITGRYRWALWSGWFLTTFGYGLLIYLEVDTSTVSWIFLTLVPGLGTGMLFSAMAIAVQASATNEDQAAAVTMFSFLRVLGQTLGVAIGGVIFQNQVKKKLLTYPPLAANATAYSKDASGLVGIIKAMPDGLAKSQLKESYVCGLRYVWIVTTALAAVALFSSFFADGLPLDRALETQQGFKHQERIAQVEENKDSA
ncbi:MFS general substrate transporter [Saccharata proteae CBS 121410]|uniref:MFS general substrate transporter n=1 Tax=Saccharata proteae CBS 121410 TaxID=1314787 RepID=A0A9P4HTJ6_9PEZI|nr:MFS general substrate transporter [Saccharata proteae CBS 121410]